VPGPRYSKPGGDVDGSMVQGGGTTVEGGNGWGWGDAGVGWDAHGIGWDAYGIGWDAYGVGQVHSARKGDQEVGSSSVPHFWDSENDMDSTSEAEGDANDIRVAYRLESWTRQYATYDQEPMHFSQENIGLTEEYDSVPSYVALFRKFWSHETLRKVCRETNCYAGSLDENGNPRGRAGWYPMTEKELKVFMAVIFYMGMKKLPNMKAY
jgi:hypothetical protein